MSEKLLIPHYLLSFPKFIQLEVKNMATENTTHKKSSLLKWLGLLVLVVLLVAAAFVGGQLLNRANPQAGGPNGPGLVISGQGSGGGERMEVQLQVTPAPELPTRQPDANGLFISREDNTISIGTGNVTMIIDSEGQSSSNYEGPVVEIVVTGDTQVYKEVNNFPGPPGTGETEQVIQQEVAEGSIEELGENSHVSVWGRKVGDRIIADILVYSEPVVMKFAP
ncbi:MAG: hypothetical protein Fur0022_43940 [Anaerolineales bacterium]